LRNACVFYYFNNPENVFISFSSFFIISEQQGTHRLIWRDDQKPQKKKKNIFGCRSVNAAAHEKTPRRPQKRRKRDNSN
jgi:hypothetical protein